MPHGASPVALRDVLSWRDPGTSDAVAAIERAYAARMAACLSELANVEGGPAAAGVLAQLAELPPEAVRRILLAPETAYQATTSARGGGISLFHFLREVIAAERMRGRVGEPLGSIASSSAWSATGDMKFCLSDKGCVSIVHIADKLGMFPIVLDWNGWDDGRSADSGFVAMDSLFFGNSSVPDGYALAREKLEIAAGVIRRTCPMAAALIEGSLRVVHLRQTASAPDAYYSYSQRDIIGRCVLVNAHLQVADIGTLVNALIHEAIHNFLYRIEQTHPLVCLPAAEGKMVTYRSSWSGNRLRSSTYVHACYIYFALTQFWLRSDCHDLMGKEICEAQLQFLGRGFSGNIGILGEVVSDVSIKSDTLDDIISMTKSCVGEKWPESLGVTVV